MLGIRFPIAQDPEELMNSAAPGRFAILIPVYNHADGIGPVIERARGLGLPIWVVDDGSTDGTADRLKSIVGITVIPAMDLSLSVVPSVEPSSTTQIGRPSPRARSTTGPIPSAWL